MKLFIILSRVPYPLEKGDKLRAFNQIVELSKKHEIYLFAFNDTKLHPLATETLNKYCKKVTIFNLSILSIFLNIIKAFFKVLPIQIGYFYNKKAHKILLSELKDFNPDHIFCQIIRVSEYVKDIKTPKTLDYQDAFSKGLERRISKSNIFQKPFFILEFLRVKKYETKIFDYFDNKIIISEQDKKYINHPKSNEIEVVINGVDTNYYNSTENHNKIYDLIFVGNMNYPPNIDAVCYVVKEILPLLNEKINFIIAGANPSKKVQSLASNRVFVTGWIDDLRGYYSKSKIFIAPMQIGIGLQNKLLEAMAMKIPCITSKLANNALGGTHNKNILIGETPSDYAYYINELLLNKDKIEEISNNGHDYILNNFSWKNSVAKLETIFYRNSK